MSTITTAVLTPSLAPHASALPTAVVPPVVVPTVVAPAEPSVLPSLLTPAQAAEIAGCAPDPTAPVLAAHLHFTSRATYQAWVARWRAEYAALSADQRATRAELRAVQRAGESAWALGPQEIANRTMARALLVLRAASRVAAQAQWRAGTAARLTALLPRELPTADQEPALDPATLGDLLLTMHGCAQARGQSVLDHGLSVWRHARELLRSVETGAAPAPLADGPEGAWRLPEWWAEAREALRARLLDPAVLSAYAVFHDVGKPACRTVDAEGRAHFPDHAAVSAGVWRARGGTPAVARLLAADMAMHTMKAVDVPEFAATPEAASLVLMSLAEVHSNAAMFGGTATVSFKSKWSQIDRRGRAILRAWADAPAAPAPASTAPAAVPPIRIPAP